DALRVVLRLGAHEVNLAREPCALRVPVPAPLRPHPLTVDAIGEPLEPLLERRAPQVLVSVTKADADRSGVVVRVVKRRPAEPRRLALTFARCKEVRLSPTLDKGPLCWIRGEGRHVLSVRVTRSEERRVGTEC